MSRKKKSPQDQARSDIRVGAFWLIGGIIITIVTYSMSATGGRYIVAWGAILFGGIQLLRGLSNLHGQPGAGSTGTVPESVVCPHCGEELELSPEERQDARYTCPICYKTSDVPRLPAAAPPPTGEIECPSCHSRHTPSAEALESGSFVCPTCNRTMKV